jgi:sulfur-carrier protein adenylyltransferase/sulfurtransferase
MALSSQQLIAQTKAEIREITVQELRERIADQPGLTVVDVREPDETANGQIAGATVIPRGFLELRIENAAPERNQPIAIYCAGGTRSAFAAKTLAQLGYTDVVSVAGGFTAWKNAGYPIKVEKPLTQEQKNRYARHFSLPEVGEAGQRKLLDSKVLLVGAGGLGSPTALYLAAAGVGTIGIIDSDVVDASNLQRQILHDTNWIGKPKVDSAEHRLTTLNPDVKVVKYEKRLDSSNALDIFAGYDVIVDGCDNFPTRYLVNDACAFLKKPNVHGSIFWFDGQVTTFDPGNGGPCYRCLFPEPPPPELAPSCAEAGVLGVLPGIVGTLQAMETIKVLLGAGDSLVGRVLAFDGLAMKFREYKQKRNHDCPVCGDHPTITQLIDYEWFCSSAHDKAHDHIHESLGESLKAAA